MKRLTFAGLFLCILAIPLEGFAITPPSLAQATNIVQENTQTAISLYRGQGVTLNFRPTGETIQRAWLDDPSQTTLDFDDTNCASADAEGCAASVIHLRRINPIDFPGLPTTDVTNLTVLTDSDLYSFRLTFPDTGNPSYTVLNIEPERDTELSKPSPLSDGAPAEGIEAIEQGLALALSRDLITTGDPLWERTQTFLLLMRDGLSVQAAARQAGISQSLIIRLTELGQQSPTLAI
jgi:hypothetical protein